MHMFVFIIDGRAVHLFILWASSPPDTQHSSRYNGIITRHKLSESTLRKEMKGKEKKGNYLDRKNCHTLISTLLRGHSLSFLPPREFKNGTEKKGTLQETYQISTLWHFPCIYPDISRVVVVWFVILWCTCKLIFIRLYT